MWKMCPQKLIDLSTCNVNKMHIYDGDEWQRQQTLPAHHFIQLASSNGATIRNLQTTTDIWWKQIRTDLKTAWLEQKWFRRTKTTIIISIESWERTSTKINFKSHQRACCTCLVGLTSDFQMRIVSGQGVMGAANTSIMHRKVMRRLWYPHTHTPTETPRMWCFF